MATPSGSKDGQTGAKWGAVVLFVLVVAIVRGVTHPGASAPVATPIQPAPLIEAGAPPEQPAPPPDVVDADIGTAARHAGLALGAEGVGGARIYSENCYAALERSFDAARLDRCGAFDLLAAREPADPLDQSPAATWFEPSAMSARYTKAAARGGVPADMIAGRLAHVTQLANAVIVESVAPPQAEAADEEAAPEAARDPGDAVTGETGTEDGAEGAPDEEATAND